ncbi:MAG: NAD(P)(+) transhydrogenase (Re/Si-specific) subunit beta, partial [Verrucomicrobiales bacterium]|nr:NAD(P)(+) transhydrogenase (Re/Si-specific) subunit beta [Verrucomicrobiales bacterium]
MEKLQFINFAYIIAAVLFIFGIKMLGSATTARRGNMISSIGMLLAVVVTLFKGGLDFTWIIAGIAIGTAIGGICAKKVQMTGMPELVALFNGFGGLASVLVGWAEFAKDPTFGGEGGMIKGTAVVLAILIGAITFTGSIVAYLKLSGKIGGSATVFPGQKIVNAGVLVAIVVIGVLFVISPSANLVYLLIGLSCLLGVLGVIPIGGGDMPVV